VKSCSPCERYVRNPAHAVKRDDLTRKERSETLCSQQQATYHRIRKTAGFFQFKNQINNKAKEHPNKVAELSALWEKWAGKKKSKK